MAFCGPKIAAQPRYRPGRYPIGWPGADDALWAALRRAGPGGVPVAELLAATGMPRATLYRRLRAHARAGRVVQTVRAPGARSGRQTARLGTAGRRPGPPRHGGPRAVRAVARRGPRAVTASDRNLSTDRLTACARLRAFGGTRAVRRDNETATHRDGWLPVTAAGGRRDGSHATEGGNLR